MDNAHLVSPLQAFVIEGRTGVSLFFILSGFLLSLPFLTEIRGGNRVIRSDYYARRALRILPLYYAAVMAASVLSAASVSDLVRGVPYLLFLNAADLATPLLPYSAVWWSLATEVEFYLLLPLLPLVMRSRGGRWAGVVVLCAYGAALSGFLTHAWHAQTITGQIVLAHSLFGRAPLFLLGGVAALVYLHYGSWLRERLPLLAWMRLGGADVSLLAAWVGLGFLLQWVVLRGYWQAEARVAHLWHLLEGGLWAVVLLLLLVAPLRTKRVFSNRVLSTIGLLSYSIYMLHLPLLSLSVAGVRRWKPAEFAGWGPPMVAVIVLTLLSCIALSAVTYRTIERPFLKRKAQIDR